MTDDLHDHDVPESLGAPLTLLSADTPGDFHDAVTALVSGDPALTLAVSEARVTAMRDGWIVTLRERAPATVHALRDLIGSTLHRLAAHMPRGAVVTVVRAASPSTLVVGIDYPPAAVPDALLTGDCPACGGRAVLLSTTLLTLTCACGAETDLRTEQVHAAARALAAAQTGGGTDLEVREARAALTLATAQAFVRAGVWLGDPS